MKDDLAIACSGACMVHCLLTPMIIGFGAAGLVGEWLSSEWVHRLMLVPVVLLALLSLPGSYRVHKNQWPLLLGVMGVLTMVSALLGPESLEAWITISGGLLLITAHLWNRKLSLRLLLPQREHANG
ncbi:MULTISPECIES: MerC domain-containing protein [unclassified Methylophaga]|uniref:MerC domain-containing protein n=1 Tax=unclassified Methylophaga TaxID=2629249 RepID=UPI000C959923|nr:MULTISPECIES: MerC domain-containing protein [unclassified Methylophaga]MAK65681.1 merC mercury resistance protein [Methylophaga sp.]MAY16405.1 merC mercury resistance protein [Methylophaga sp.]MBN45095.1 merC mercury resistance protein [Methylophaga sp.]HAO25951.1 MerC domain-containing protein [Methylophaga sp.]HCD05347.1 MerC domain-containing protein [Methylophaga sp.]